ncbi:MAG: HTTM domain-containing protein [Pirellulaceae bacterium]
MSGVRGQPASGPVVAAWIREGWQGWDRFWFTPTDPATLCMIRVLGGSMILYTHLVWTLVLTDFFGANSPISLEYARQFQRGFADAPSFAIGYLHWFQQPMLLWIVHLAALVVLFLFTIGLWTRVTSILTFLIVVSYVHRVPGALFGLDQINVMLSLYLMVGPCGAMYSVDAWRRGGGGGTSGQPAVTATIAIRLIQLHMCIIYFFAGIGKLQGDFWWDGTALWYALANYEYQSWDMTWTAHTPWLIDLLTHITIAWEISYPALVWPRWTRPVVVALSVPLHLGIALCMGMITFGLIMLVGNMAFISPRLIRNCVDGTVGRWTGQVTPI